MAPVFPEALVVHPRASHKLTFILLHGRGSSASEFGPPLLEYPIPDVGTLPEAFPNARFVFLTAAKSRATIYKRSIIKQWFDNWELTSPNHREELQIDGLRNSSAHIHSIIAQEAALVGDTQNIILGGLSQGCAASLISLLLWNGEPLGAFVGMCGWLPFRKKMEDISSGQNSDSELFAGEDFNPFGAPSVDDDTITAYTSSNEERATAFLRDELDMPGSFTERLSFQETPIFLGHGKEGGRVPMQLGKEATSCLESLGANVSWNEYGDLGHWYSSDMLYDLADFIKENLLV